MISINNISLSSGKDFFLIAGPCVIENEAITIDIARSLQKMCADRNIPFIFKASFDKANRTSLSAYRGPGLTKGLQILNEVKTQLKVNVISDIHEPEQAAPAAEVLDVLQIPAFLCRQTDLLLAAGNTKKAVNIKKAQFLAPQDMKHVIDKISSTGNKNLLLTERGTSFGYHNLVVDMRSIPEMATFGYPIVFDATHSVQTPGGAGSCSGGDRTLAPILAQAAVAAGADGILVEVYPEPDNALCDGPNSIRLSDLPAILDRLLAVYRAIHS